MVADTNVVTEFMRDRPDPHVLTWAASIPPASLAVTVVTVEEIERGLGRLRDGRRRQDLAARWRRLVDQYADAILTYDVPAARATAAVLVHREATGRPMGLADAQIAGICLNAGLTLATRNVRDFEDVPGLDVIDPFGTSDAS
ncbi:MAG: PIN domain-containing protein [Nocardioides sp.]